MYQEFGNTSEISKCVCRTHPVSLRVVASNVQISPRCMRDRIGSDMRCPDGERQTAGNWSTIHGCMDSIPLGQPVKVGWPRRLTAALLRANKSDTHVTTISPPYTGSTQARVTCRNVVHQPVTARLEFTRLTARCATGIATGQWPVAPHVGSQFGNRRALASGPSTCSDLRGRTSSR